MLNKESNHFELMVIDCRYPYEFEGGHIKGALNMYTEEMMHDTFIKYPIMDKEVLIVIHCEFSSCRGPAEYVHFLILLQCLQ
jgi:rhodanese-related sulfurtransferase